jgi:hypothetical protein
MKNTCLLERYVVFWFCNKMTSNLNCSMVRAKGTYHPSMPILDVALQTTMVALVGYNQGRGTADILIPVDGSVTITRVPDLPMSLKEGVELSRQTTPPLATGEAHIFSTLESIKVSDGIGVVRGMLGKEMGWLESEQVRRMSDEEIRNEIRRFKKNTKIEHPSERPKSKKVVDSLAGASWLANKFEAKESGSTRPARPRSESDPWFIIVLHVVKFRADATETEKSNAEAISKFEPEAPLFKRVVPGGHSLYKERLCFGAFESEDAAKTFLTKFDTSNMKVDITQEPWNFSVSKSLLGAQ